MNIDYIKELKNQARVYGVEIFVNKVLNDEDFRIWSGAGKPEHHHYGDGGLLKHTYEVWMLARSIWATHKSYGDDNHFDQVEVFVSVIWHDFGKLWDYQKDDDGVWGKHDNHARTIHHISRSAIEWERHVDRIINNPIYEDTVFPFRIENVTHNILSHHGMREWGSPVAPATKEAWVLHLADNLSARLDDCDKHDRIKGK
jgi:3'-5' exoribonuclease